LTKLPEKFNWTLRKKPVLLNGLLRPIPLIWDRPSGTNTYIESSLKRSEFGMTKYLPGIEDDVKVLVPVEAYRN